MNFDPSYKSHRAQQVIDQLVSNAVCRVHAHLRAIDAAPGPGECSMTQTACNIAAELCRCWPHVSFDLQMADVASEQAGVVASALVATVKVSWTDGPDVACVRERLWTFVPGMELERAGASCPSTFEAVQAVAHGFQSSFGRVAAVHLERGTSSEPGTTPGQNTGQKAILAARAIARAAGGGRSADGQQDHEVARRSSRGWLEQVLQDREPGPFTAAADAAGVAVLH